ncbi:MAG: hypothetical protein II443_01550 [Oscillospiraceae bacterium]|nr:hypothetical protein [Oscillospiraceae bacterium]
MGNWFRNFMMWRYGPDQLSLFTLALSFIFNLIGAIFNLWPLSLLAYLLLILTIFRFLSRNIRKRRAENDKFIKYWWPFKTKAQNFFRRIKDSRKYKFFRCPSCKNRLRVPRGKGKIKVTCPKCGERFQKKT